MKNIDPTYYRNMNWSEMNMDEISDFFYELEDPVEQAEFLIFLVKEYPTLELPYPEWIEDTTDNLLYQNKTDLVYEMIDAFKYAVPDLYDESYLFLEKKLIHYYFYQNNLPKVLKRLEIIKQNPVQGIDIITIQSLYLLIYHGCYKEAYEYSREVWKPIFDSDEIVGNAHAPFVINIYLYELEQVYERINQNQTVDWDRFYKKMIDLDFEEEKDVMNAVIHCLENPFNKEEIVSNIKNKQHRKVHTMMNIHFLKYMKEKYSMSFTHSDLLFNVLAKKELYKGNRKQGSYFLFSFDKLDKHISNLFDSIFLSNVEELFGKVWGLSYVYEFIHEVGMISDEGFEQMNHNINALKYLLVRIVGVDLWKMTFVFKWPDIQTEDSREEEIFRSTFYEDNEAYKERLLNYKRMLYSALADNIKNKVSDPDDSQDYNDLQFIDELKDEMNESIDEYLDEEMDEDNDSSTPFLSGNPYKPYVKEEPDVGRNDPCPCGSGKKYKKCCLGKK